MDSITALLSLIVVVLLLLKHWCRSPAPQLHPFLLGRQSLVSSTRQPHESPVYTSAISGGLIAPLRPEKRIRTLKDIVLASRSSFDGGDGSKEGTWSVQGEVVGELVDALRYGLVGKFERDAAGGGLIAVLVDELNDALLVILALALTRFKPVVISPSSSIPSELRFVGAVCSVAHLSAVRLLSLPASKVLQLQTSEAEDLLVTGKMIRMERKERKEGEGEGEETVLQQPTDLALIFVSNDIVLEYSHMNITASLTTWLSIFPTSTPIGDQQQQPSRPSARDTITSLHSPSTPYGFGLTLLALYMHSKLCLPSLPNPCSPEMLDRFLNASAAPRTTLLFLNHDSASQMLQSHVLQKMEADSSFLIGYARTGKLRLLRRGVVSRSTYWDRVLFDGVRKDAGLTDVRAVLVQGAMRQSVMEFLRVTLGCPTVPLLLHSALLAPLTAGLFYDVQRLPAPGKERREGEDKELMGHVGAPAAGIELKVIGKEEEMLAGRRRGEIVFRSAMLPNLATLRSDLIHSQASLPALPRYPSSKVDGSSSNSSSVKWLRSGVMGEMAKEGTLWL